MSCLLSGVGHDLVMPNIEIIYRNSCDATEPSVVEIVGVTGMCNRRIITIPCDGCEFCRGIRTYGCRIKNCNVIEDRNTKSRVLTLVEPADCIAFIAGVTGSDPYADISTFEAAVCANIESLGGVTGLYGDIIITGPLPAFEEQYVVGTVNDGVCTPTGINVFSPGIYRLENCGGTTEITITNSTP